MVSKCSAKEWDIAMLIIHLGVDLKDGIGPRDDSLPAARTATTSYNSLAWCRSASVSRLPFGAHVQNALCIIRQIDM